MRARSLTKPGLLTMFHGSKSRIIISNMERCIFWALGLLISSIFFGAVQSVIDDWHNSALCFFVRHLQMLTCLRPDHLTHVLYQKKLQAILWVYYGYWVTFVDFVLHEFTLDSVFGDHIAFNQWFKAVGVDLMPTYTRQSYLLVQYCDISSLCFK